MDKGPDY
jgi:serine/threonine protein kinase